MALNANEGYSGRSVVPADVKLEATQVKVKTIDGITGAPLITRGTPLSFNTSTKFWEKFAGGGVNGTNVVKGFAYEDIQSHATNEVQGNVMLAGEIHYRELKTIFDAGDIAGTETQLKDAFKDGPRALGLTIVGLGEVR